MNKFQKLWLLFKTTFLISITANSGLAIISVLKTTFSSKYKWFTEDEMTDYVALAQSCPGALAVNACSIVGFQSAGLPGALAAVLGCIIPPIIVMILVTLFYTFIISNRYIAVFMEGMSYGVVAMLLDVLIGIFINVTKKGYVYPIIVIILSFIYIKLLNLSQAYLIFACIITGVVKTLILKKKMEVKQ